MIISNDSKGIIIDGHRGKWYVISSGFHNSEEVFLLEHETYGEDAAALIVDKFGNIVMDEVYNGLSDLDML